MKLSKENLSKYAKLYLNDLEDYGDEDELNENKINFFRLFIENLKTSNNVISLLKEEDNKEEMKDFLTYIKNIENQ